MLLKTKGIPWIIKETIVGRVTRDAYDIDSNSVLIAEDKIILHESQNFKAILTNLPNKLEIDIPLVYSVETFDHLLDGDIVAINNDGTINTLYRVASNQNFILFTERCNSNCLMCSQPPKDKDDSKFLVNLHKQLIPLIPKNCHEIGITGGEPTLLENHFFELLELIKQELPETEVHCLTNGRSFAWNNIAKRLGMLQYNQLMLGIPLYSDYYKSHDYIVQAKNAFNQTIKGLYNLATYDIRIEIRIVLQKETIQRLVKLAKYIYKNLPFVEHVAFMGLEYQGYTPYNIHKLWIEPLAYMEELKEAANFLSDQGINVSIYNSQLCVMPKELWKYNKKSISDWKNIYLSECSKCTLMDKCGGLFASGERKHSEFIKAIEIC